MDNIFIKKIKTEFKKATILNKIIYLNVIIFIIINVLNVIAFMLQFNINPILEKFYLPANTSILIKQPWTFFTYIFIHTKFLHLIFNMTWLYFSGKLFLQYLDYKQLIYIYILGGIFGGLLFIISYNYIPALNIYTENAQALGSSAAVLAILIAIITYIPNYTIQLPLLGFIKIKYIGICIIFIDILSIPKGNAGGHIAHIGGAIFGYIYIKQLKKQTKYNTKFKNIFQKIINHFKPIKKIKSIYKRPKSDYEFNTQKAKNQKKIDQILEKISNSGYDSLSSAEKSILFNASKK
tara:strand:+ start:6939 stop:7820 length:882 start_codon:yes stop_codon:yes gene_type:complete